jgi:phage tail-like protein
VSGLDSSRPSIDYREGTDPNPVRKLTGLNQFTVISLKRGVTDSDELWKWRQTVVDGKPDRRNGSIVLLDEAGQEKIRWNFHRAWPSKWTGPSFKSKATTVAIETLELTHEELKRA